MASLKNINTIKIREECYNLIDDINNNLSDEELQDKYNYLYSKTKTLFKMILRDKKSGNFNKKDFEKHLDSTLHLITNMQDSSISNEDGTKNILELMNNAYIPSKFLKK